jgi:HEAT repeat protein
VSWLNFVVLGGWLVLVVHTRRLYLSALRESIHQHRLDAERASALALDRSTRELLASRLDAVDPEEILYALSLFTVGRSQASHPAVRGLLKHPSPEVRQRAVAILDSAEDRSVVADVEELLHDPHLGVRTEALLYLTHHSKIDPLARIHELGDFQDFSIRSAVLAYLARSVDNPDAVQLMFDSMAAEQGPEGRRARLEAVRLAASMPGHFDGQLRRLIDDTDATVAREAVRAAGGLGEIAFAPALLGRLGDPALAADAGDAIGALGSAVVPLLREQLADESVPAEVRRAIPAVLSRIGTPAAAAALCDHIFEADSTLRLRVISALNKLHRQHPELQVDPLMIETALAAEIMGHYRSYQILGRLGTSGADDPAARGLREAMSQEVERIFRLLGLLYPRFDLHSAYVGLQSKSPVVHDQALDFLDQVLKPEMRGVLVPLLDGGVGVAERVRLANRLVGAPVTTPEQAVAALISSRDPWLRSCAAYAIGALGLRSLEAELDAWLQDPDPLLRETVRQAKLKLGAAAEARAAQ